MVRVLIRAEVTALDLATPPTSITIRIIGGNHPGWTGAGLSAASVTLTLDAHTRITRAHKGAVAIGAG
jgi:carbon monoxide dehydrogenase subunit G